MVLHGASGRQAVDVSMFVAGSALESMRVSPNAADELSHRGMESEEGALVGPQSASSPAATKGAGEGWDG